MAKYMENYEKAVFLTNQGVAWVPHRGGIVGQSTGLDQQRAFEQYSQLRDRVRFLEKRIVTNVIPVHTLGSHKWELKDALNVTVEQRAEDRFIACLYDVDLYGYGETIPEALDDLKEAIVNQLEFLLEEAKTVELGVVPKKQFNFLRRCVVSADA